MGSQELDILQRAFAWEQQQMDAWSSRIKADLDSDSDRQNEMKQLLFDAWVQYFQSLKNSDQRVIDACSKSDDAAKAAIFNIMDASTEYDDVRARIKEFLTG